RFDVSNPTSIPSSRRTGSLGRRSVVGGSGRGRVAVWIDPYGAKEDPVIVRHPLGPRARWFLAAEARPLGRERATGRAVAHHAPRSGFPGGLRYRAPASVASWGCSVPAVWGWRAGLHGPA